MSLSQEVRERVSETARGVFEPAIGDASALGRSQDRTHEHLSVSERLLTSALIVGFGLFAVGVLTASLSPADGYEVSVYAATPIYWGCVAVATLVAVFTLLYGYRTRLALPSLLLGGLSVASVLSLPVIRGYYFHGYEDPLTHLGQIRALWGGWMTFFDTVYPGTYSTTVLFGSFAGIPARRAMLYTMFVFGLVYLVFVPLVVRAIVRDRRAVMLAAFSGFLLLPINNVATYFRFHVFSLTTLFAPVVLYVLVKHLSGAFDDDSLPWLFGPALFVFPLVSAAVLFFHPQAAADVLVILGSVVGLQVVFSVLWPNHPLGNTRRLYGQFLFLTIVFLVWAGSHETGTSYLDRLVTVTQSWVADEAQTAAIVQKRTDSAETISVSIYELFVKYFSVSMLYVSLAAGLVGSFLLGRLGSDESDNIETVGYFTFGGLLLLPVMLIHTFGSADAYLFRHIGFGMVLITLLGAVALYYLVRRAGRTFSRPQLSWLKPAAGVVAVGILLFSIVTVYSSPFLYLPGQHVSEYQMNGYETSFEMQDDERKVWFGGIRRSSNRYEDAMFALPGGKWDGPSPDARSSGPVASENVTNLERHYETHWEEIVRRDHYFVVSERDYEAELVAYDGIRYSRADIDSVRNQTATYPVYSNGNFNLYYVDTQGDPLMDEAIEAED